MNIVETQIPDVNIENIDSAKVDLANRIIKNVSPLFNEVYIDRANELARLKLELKRKRLEVKKKKDDLEELFSQYKKKEKVRKLLSRISKLVSSGLVFEGTLKRETVVLLKVLDDLSDERLDYHLQESMKIISQRFSRVK